MNHKCIMIGIFNRKVPNWVEVSIWSESIWYNHQFLDGWHWYALKIWLKNNNKTPQASSCSACFMVPLRFWLWDPLLGICKSTSINHLWHVDFLDFLDISGHPPQTIFGYLPTSNAIWIQKQSFRKSHDRPALVSWATLVWNSRRNSRMSKSCSYDPSKFSQLKHTLSNNHVPNLHVSSLRVETHFSWALFGIPFQRCHAICPIASPFIFES